jgi:hypothetical protein
MVLDLPEPHPPTPEDNMPIFYKYLWKHHLDKPIDLPILEEGYPENYPDLLYSR